MPDAHKDIRKLKADVAVPPKPVTTGLTCRSCGCRHFYVIYTRRAPDSKLIRWRECRHCGRRVTTYEVTPSKLADVTA